jgi:hypothetical protein
MITSCLASCLGHTQSAECLRRCSLCTLVPPTGLSLPAGDKAVFVRKAWSRPELSCTAAEGSLGTGSPSGKQMSELHSACEVHLIMGKTLEKNLVRTIAGKQHLRSLQAWLHNCNPWLLLSLIPLMSGL